MIHRTGISIHKMEPPYNGTKGDLYNSKSTAQKAFFQKEFLGSQYENVGNLYHLRRYLT